MLKSCSAAVCLVLLLTGVCAAGPSGVKWTSYYMTASDGQAQGVACYGNKVYAAGNYWDPTKTPVDGSPALIAYNVKTGAASPITLFESSPGMINAVRTYGGRIYATGQYVTTGYQQHAFVSAYSPKGDMIWEQLWLDSGNKMVNDITMISNRVIAAGIDGANAFNVAALNGANGNVLWSTSSETLGSAFAVTASNGRVFAVGRYLDWANYRTKFAVRAFNAATGALLWEDSQGTAGQETSYNFSEAFGVAASANRVYVVGSLHNDDYDDGGAAFAVRAYDARTGGLIWKDYYNFYTYFDDSANAVVLQGNVLLVGGHVARQGGGKAFTVRAYNATNGTVLWTSMTGGYNIEDNTVQALTVAAGRLYAAGAATDDHTGFATKAYNLAKGTVLWEDIIGSQAAKTDNLAPVANAVCAVGDGVFSGGTSSVTGQGQAFTVRAHTAQ